MSKLKPRQLRAASWAAALFSCLCEVLGLVDKLRPTHGQLWAMGSGSLALGQRGCFLTSRQLSSHHFLPSGIHGLVSLQACPHHSSPRGELLCPSSLILWSSIYHSLRVIVKYTWHKVDQDSLLVRLHFQCLQCGGHVFSSLVGELRSHMPCSAAKRLKKKAECLVTKMRCAAQYQ